MIRTNLLPEDHRSGSRRKRRPVVPLLLVGVLGFACWQVGSSSWRAFEIHQAQVSLRRYDSPDPQWASTPRVSYGKLFRALAEALPDNDLWLLGFEDDDGGTVVRGQARKDEAVFAYLGDLRESPEIHSAHILRLFRDPQGRAEFLVQVDAGHQAVGTR